MRKALLIISLILVFGSHLVSPPLGSASRIESPVTLKEMVSRSDIIFKGVAQGTEHASTPFLQEQYRVKPYNTKFKVISILKGKLEQPNLVFQHYKEPGRNSRGILPKHKFEVGRPYIVFARKIDQLNILVPLWEVANLREVVTLIDQGVFWVASTLPVSKDTTIQNIIWDELNSLLESGDLEAIMYAVRQLDLMSRKMGELSTYPGTQEFDRNLVLDKIHRFIFSESNELVGTTLRALGNLSPFLYEDSKKAWSITVREVTGLKHFGKRDKTIDNIDARRYWKEIARFVDQSSNVKLQELAIRALSRVGEGELIDLALRWLDSPDPEVRYASLLLLSDFHESQVLRAVRNSSEDPSFAVRVAVALAIGLGQFDQLVSVLEKLLKDEVQQVQAAAVSSLGSFSYSKIRPLLMAHIDHPAFGVKFVHILAEQEPELYLDYLSLHLANPPPTLPPQKWNYKRTFWKILFDYLKQQPELELNSEKVSGFLDTLEQAALLGNGEPKRLYAFFLKNHMANRAEDFRKNCREKLVLNC